MSESAEMGAEEDMVRAVDENARGAWLLADVGEDEEKDGSLQAVCLKDCLITEGRGLKTCGRNIVGYIYCSVCAGAMDGYTTQLGSSGLWNLARRQGGVTNRNRRGSCCYEQHVVVEKNRNVRRRNPLCAAMAPFRRGWQVSENSTGAF